MTEHRRLFALSRPECAMLLGVLVVVISLVLSSAATIRHRSKLVSARDDLRRLTAAGTRFFSEYRSWPSAYVGEFGDHHYGVKTSNREVVHALLALDGPGNEEHQINVERIVFLNLPKAGHGISGLSAEGFFLDPWGAEYQIVLDTDFDNICTIENSIYHHATGEGMIAWSLGPDGKSGTGDDILSWE